MSKAQLALTLGAILCIVALFQLPRVVVENEKVGIAESETHGFEMPENVRVVVTELRSLWASEIDIQKKLNFADSLATLYLDYQLLDSSVWFTDYIQKTNSKGRELRIADLYYWAFQRAPDAMKAKEIGSKAGKELNKLIRQYPENSSLKNRLAMTLVATENPMQGIQMLRDVLATKPGDVETLKNLGILSIQSGQFDKAEERFRELLAIDANDMESLFYLGMSLVEQDKPEGLQIMEGLASNSTNPAIKALATEYLEK